ncbi:questin oxidase family protein [Sphaerisporangium corydalis]|uniref:Questin oxidase family protein n=1 Tax=Sphaerisporangium corydalis TaxID=1441875 RepID=A0ABV9EFX1_9ACTN|nr:questin oxidase family protein [Sphaerisporangium corydalis]
MSGTLNEAYERFRDTGPEWGEDTLTNHGPMAAEVLVRRGRADEVPAWVHAYIRRLDELPAPSERVTEENWRLALGDGRRVGDWSAYFERQTREHPWREVLVTWWPRLLPGIAAGTTHGVIRVAHAVRALTAGGAEGPAAVTELAHGLAFWAARSLSVPEAPAPSGGLPPATALDAVARIPEQRGSVATRLGRLPGLAGWPGSVAALRAPSGPDDARDLLGELVTAATLHYLTHGHGSPVLLVHTATAPNAVLHTLPVLPREMWAPSLTAIWRTTAAIVSAYAPAGAAPRAALPVAPEADDPVAEVLDRAVAHGDEHVIKFTDTAAEVYSRTGDPGALAAALRVGALIAAP